jgi:hypothetical protein
MYVKPLSLASLSATLHHKSQFFRLFFRSLTLFPRLVRGVRDGETEHWNFAAVRKGVDLVQTR